MAHCLLVPGLAEGVSTTIRKAWLNHEALGMGSWDLLDVIEKQQRRYGSLILKQTDWPQRVRQAYLEKQYQDNPDHAQGFVGIVAAAWDLAFGPAPLLGSLEEGQGHLREVMRSATRTRLLELLRGRLESGFFRSRASA